jgi:hypothetical protein
MKLVARAHRVGPRDSPPTPITPVAIGMPPSVSMRMVSAAVCQPLAARPLNKVALAASGSRWNGCGSNSPAKRTISSAVTDTGPAVNRWPT